MFKQKDAVKIANLLDLSKKDQDILIGKIRGGNSKERHVAKQILLERCKPVVEAISRRYLTYDISSSKLFNAGNKGLEKAIKKYNPTRRYRFIVYATWWVRAEIHGLLGLPIDPELSK